MIFKCDKNQTVLYRDSCFKFDITRSANGIYNEEQGLKVSHWKENKTLNRKCIHDLFCPRRNLNFFLKIIIQARVVIFWHLTYWRQGRLTMGVNDSLITNQRYHITCDIFHQ